MGVFGGVAWGKRVGELGDDVRSHRAVRGNSAVCTPLREPQLRCGSAFVSLGHGAKLAYRRRPDLRFGNNAA
jgi:hypothetical protein